MLVGTPAESGNNDGHVAITSGRLQKGTNHAKIILDARDQIELGACYLLPLIMAEDEDRRWKTIHGILLSCASSSGGNAYRRMGYFETTAVTRLFYGIEVSLSTASVDGNLWDAINSYPQVDNEITREHGLLGCPLH
jgi:hypothetical protein